MIRRVLVLVLVVACAAGVVAFQTTRSAGATPNPRVFVPSVKFYRDFSPSYRTTVADVYWLLAIQYYGEHVNSDHRLDSLPAMIDLVTKLSPRFREPYYFGAFASIDMNEPGYGYDLLKRGLAANPTDWHFPFYLGFFVYAFADNADKDQIAARYYAQAAKLPGSLPSIPRIAAALYTKGHEREKAMVLWAQVYGQGDKYAQEKAVAGLNLVLPKERTARMKAVAGLRDLMSPQSFDQLTAELSSGHP